MANVASKKKPLILVSKDYDPKAWEALDAGESEFDSWAAVAQDIWGAGCFGPGQSEMMEQGLNGAAINKSKIIGVIGSTLGGAGVVAESKSAYVDVIECNAEFMANAPPPPLEAKNNRFLKFSSWDPQKLAIQPARYHGLAALGAISLTPNLSDTIQVLAEAIKPGGFLSVDEVFVSDPSAAALIGQGIARPGEKLHLRSAESVSKGFVGGAFMDMRSNVQTGPFIMEAIRTGLKSGRDIAQILTTIPKPFRKQRMTAFVGELQRAAVLYQALEKGLATTARMIFRQGDGM
jgi:hypothetical protein